MGAHGRWAPAWRSHTAVSHLRTRTISDPGSEFSREKWKIREVNNEKERKKNEKTTRKNEKQKRWNFCIGESWGV